MGKIQYKKVRELSESEVAYLAGLVDGEGTITLSRKNKGENRRLAVVISNSEYGLLKYVLDIVGAGVITTKRRYHAHHMRAYAYQIHGQQALELLNQAFPYLKGYKQKRAKLILENYIKLTPRNGKYSGYLLAEREKFIESFFKITAKTIY